MSSLRLLVAFMVGILGACLSSKPSVATDYVDTGLVDTSHTAQTSLDWAGVYAGVIPAADCPGIEVQLTLNPNQTFKLQYKYIERPRSGFIHIGTFKWNDAGDVIILSAEALPSYYRVGENTLLQLDMDGNEIIGDLADRYVLEKMTTVKPAAETAAAQ